MPSDQNGSEVDYWMLKHARGEVRQITDKSSATSYPSVTKTDEIRENKYGKSPVYSYDGIEFTSAGFNPIENLVGPLPGDEGHRYFAVLRFAQDIEFVQGTMGLHTDISVVDIEEQGQGASMEIMVNTRTSTPAPEDLSFILGNLIGIKYRVQVRDVDYNFTKGVAAMVMPITEENFYKMRHRLIRSMTQKKLEDGANDYPWWQLDTPIDEKYPVNCTNYSGYQAGQTEFIDPRLNDIFAQTSKSNHLRDYLAAFIKAFNLGYGRYYNEEDSAHRIEIFNQGKKELYNKWAFPRMGKDTVDEDLPSPDLWNQQFGSTTVDVTAKKSD